MNNALKSIDNNALAALSARAPQNVVNAIKTASAKTGVSFTYLMEKAAAESNFKADAKAKTSSATGLFQFIDSTWMDMLNKFGDKYGIDTNQSKKDLLELRKDPEVCSLMAAEFAECNKEHLEQTVGGKIGNTELYFAHFMGAGGASAFLSQLKKNPMAAAADLFPKEASANRGVFYDRETGAPKTLQQVYDFFDKKFSGDTQIASANTMAHKPSETTSRDEYKIAPIAYDRYTRVSGTNLRAKNSLYEMQRQMDAFFSQPSSSVPTSLYGNLTNETTLLLSMLRD